MPPRIKDESNAAGPVLPSAAWKRRFRERLLKWFGQHARDLPWRNSRDLYRIWVSEIMLQQTQVATVVDYFQRFVAAFPTVVKLAAADEHDVMRMWEGLGYYRRARQLHAAAKKIATDYNGQFPTDYEAVRALPGIGRYTAGAILSIGLDAKLPILEANTVRLLARLSLFSGDCGSRKGQDHLWAWSESLVPEKQAGKFNQALMELGSLVCTPRGPLCGECPVSSLCPTAAGGLQDKIPSPKRPKAFDETREAAVIVVDSRNRVLLRQCQAGERWAGLWDFVRVPLPAEGPAERIPDQAMAAVKSRFGFAVECRPSTATLRHGVTRFKISLFVVPATLTDKRAKLTDHFAWTSWEDLPSRALHASARKIASRLTDYLKPPS